MRSSDIRRSFCEFFKKQDHTIVASSPLVPPDDPTLLFTTAGMVQFKPLYSGLQDLPYTRAASVQKCMRAGGKGSDLENVGRTVRHHTFFEMLGNFSFGDYFKQEALSWAWEYSTQVAGLNPHRIYASVFRDDDEAWDIWTKQIGLPESRMVRLQEKDNFWGPAGETGACGPCSELYYDRGEQYGPGLTFQKATTEDRDPGSRYLEFWNCVFPQFDQQKDGSRLPLKNRGVDTGMSVERLACITQDCETLYETDTMLPVSQGLCDLLGLPSYKTNPMATRQAIHVAADHVRALVFVLSEGVLPGNEGRGYVMRRLLRRAARFGRRLGIERPFLHQVVPLIIQTMGGDYPEIRDRQDLITRVIHQEEEAFARTLGEGLRRFETVLAQLSPAAVVDGEDIFILNTTYGLPLDDIREVALDRGHQLDDPGYEKRLAAHKEESRGQARGTRYEAIHDDLKAVAETLGKTLFDGAAPADEFPTQPGPQWPTLVVDGACILFLATSTNKENPQGFDQVVQKVEPGQPVAIVLNRTTFYAESGGQIGDQGFLTTATGGKIIIHDTIKTPEDLTLHLGVVDSSSKTAISLSELVRAEVDADRRSSIMRHHTSVHLLQGALKRVLGNHVTQQGSFVGPDRLRFDFTHPEAPTPENLAEVERLVSQCILQSIPVTTQVLPLDQARQVPGVIAPFGEKYGGLVRIVAIGDWDIEFCGGTHVAHTGQIGAFALASEGAIAAGVRRIEAVVGPQAVELLQAERQLLRVVAEELKVGRGMVPQRVKSLAEELKATRKELDRLKSQVAVGAARQSLAQAETRSGIRILVTHIPGAQPDTLRDAATELRGEAGPSALVLAAAGPDRCALVCALSPEATALGLHAGNIIKQVAPLMGGSGGGKPDFAQAGGKDPSGIAPGLKKAHQLILEALTKS
jgi:alanyl-tRNA synthetase